MVYIIVDPKLLLIDSPEKPITQDTLVQFVGFITIWGGFTREHNITFGLSRECVNILKRVTRNVFSTERMTQLVEELLPHKNPQDVVKVVDSFLPRLLDESSIEPIIEYLEDHLMLDFEPARDNVKIVPQELLSGLPEDLAEAFQRMIGHITFASHNPAHKLDTLSSIYIVTPTDLTEHVGEQSVIVQMYYDWMLYDNTDENLETLTSLQATLAGIPPKTDIKAIAAPKHFKTIVDAVQAAEERYPNTLIVTDNAITVAKRSDTRKPIKVYEVLCGLVDYWLPAYEQHKNKKKADDAFYEKLRYEIGGESERVKTEPKLREQRELMHNGELLFVEDHVKMETGPNAVRVYFMPYQEDGRTKILISRAGDHPDSARYRN